MTDGDRNDKLVAGLQTIRTAGTTFIKQAHDLESLAGPPIVQELVLARRAMEDARMRYGRALAMANGQDPDASSYNAPKPKEAQS